MTRFAIYIGDYTLSYHPGDVPGNQNWFLQKSDGEGMGLTELQLRDLLHNHFAENF